MILPGHWLNIDVMLHRPLFILAKTSRMCF
jgi:hypothetical protein